MNNREERLLREYIRHNLSDQSVLSEGIKDLLKKPLSAALAKIEELINKLKSATPASDKVINALEKSGAGDFVSKVSAVGQDFETSINDAAGAVPSKMGESRRYSPMRYRRNRQPTIIEDARARRALNEMVLGGFEIAGLILAAIGGVPLLLKGLKKLAGFLGFDGVAEKLNMAYEKAHHFEEMVVDYAIPDKALYAVYLAIEEERNPEEFANLKMYQSDASDLGGQTFKSTHRRDRDELGQGTGRLKRTMSGRGLRRTLTLEEFAQSEEKQKYQKRTWAIVLLPWLISGLFSLGHMLHGIIGALEGVATGVKAVEVGTAAAEVAPGIASEIGVAVRAIARA